MAKKEAKKENNKNKKSFFKDFKAELKKVNWPTPKQLINNTVAVITIVIITSVIVFGLDIVFETLNKQGVDKLKEIVVDDNASSETTNDTSTNEVENESSDNTTTNVEETNSSETNQTEQDSNTTTESNSN